MASRKWTGTFQAADIQTMTGSGENSHKPSGRPSIAVAISGTAMWDS